MNDIIGYKIGYSNNRKVLIKLGIPKDALTNKDRHTIIDPKYAIYKCNKAIVMQIIDIYENEYDFALSFYAKNKLVYKKNKLVQSDYDDISESGKGIYFFINEELALNYRIPILYQHWKEDINIFKDYYSNGQLHKKIKYYLNSQKEIIYKNVEEYFINGQIKKEYNLDINKYDKLYLEWFDNGQLRKRLFYDKNKLLSEIENWDIRGVKH
jgi:antitoxin component YwqK of YwqJK toxin-antitoxin module